MKTFKRLMSFALALLILTSVTPTSVISARAAPTDAEMMDNFVLDSMEYLGFRMDEFKASGLMYGSSGVAASVDYAPKDIAYKESGSANGTETTADSSTPTGKAPYLTQFQYSGMCCGSFVAYYYLNYLPNIKGTDVSAFATAVENNRNGYSYRAAEMWRRTLKAVAEKNPSVVECIYYEEYTATEKDKYGNWVGKSPSAADYDKMDVGDIITFGYEKDDGSEGYSHVAIYLGAKNDKHWIAHSAPKTSDSKDVCIVFGTIEGMYFESSGKAASIVTGVYRVKNVPSVPENTGKIEVYKKDTNGKALAGAKFSATNTTTGETFYIGPTDSNGYAITEDELPFGTYKVVETVFPEGYTSNGTTEWTVTLNESTPNGTITINAVNKQASGKGKIVKKSNNGGTVEGWLFTITDSKGNVVAKDQATNSKGELTVDLAPGTYTVTETGHKSMTDAQMGYWKMDSSAQTLKVEAGKTTTITFSNRYYGKIQIQKKTNTGNNLAGWQFNIINSSGEVVQTVTTDSNGIATSGRMNPGKFTIEEIGHKSMSDAQLEYWVMSDNKTVTVEAGKIASTIFTNDHYGMIQIQKKTNTGSNLAGWQFNIINSSGEVVQTVTTNSSGIATSGMLTPGKYTIEEIGHESMSDAQLGYWVSSGSQTVTVEAGKNDTLTFTNQHMGKGKIIKTSTNGGTVKGWLFAIKDSNGNVVVQNVATNDNGEIIVDLAPGTYTVTETGHQSMTAAQKEYWEMDSSAKTLRVEAGKTVSVTFTNELNGKGKIVKTSTNGGTVEGWLFTVKDSSGKVVAQNVATNASGEIIVDLAPGTYTVTETGHQSMTATQKEYWQMDTTARTLKVEAGKTATVTFTNQLNGKGKIIKTSTNGGTVEGWLFTIKDSKGKVVAQNVATNANGEIIIDLAPGTYTVTETGHQSMTAAQKEYWQMDTTARTMKVEGGKTASVTFTNQLNGKGKIVKTSTNGGTVEGWLFTVKDSSGKVVAQNVATNASGEIIVDLAPGTYTVTETGHQSMTAAQKEYWQMDTTARTLKIEGGQTATVTFTNQLNGKGNIVKTSTNGGTVEGWLFTIKDSKGKVVAQNVATNANGEIIILLAPGTYTVTETGHQSMTAAQKEYWQMDTTARTLKIEAGKINAVTFTNQLLGKIRVQKITNTGSDLEGWAFEVKDAEGNVVATITTDANGKAETALLNPGTYTVTEVYGSNGLFGTADWFCDASEYPVMVSAGNTTVHDVLNIKGGKIKVVKSTNTGDYLNGWLFEVKNATGEVIATLETNEFGYAETIPLAPGVYTVTEVGNSQSWYDPDCWILDTSIKSVEIAADTYAEYKSVKFTNNKKGIRQIQKVVLNGGSVEGWEFKITDTDGNTVFEGKTNENGILDVILPDGTYYVYEITVRDFYENDPAEYKVLKIKAGEITEPVVFTNRYLSKLEIIKETNTDVPADYEGWVFGIYTDAECSAANRVGELTTATTSENVSGLVVGKDALYLDPGTYYIKEEGRADGSTTDENGYHWFMDSHIETVTLVGGETATVAFRNEKYGAGKIVKIAENGSSANWTFEVWRVTEEGNEYVGEYVTFEDGTITVELLPGEYIVKEKIPETPDPYWVYDTEPRTITVEAGKTTEIGPFFNTQLGKGRIIKTTNTGSNLDGWIFGVYSDPACTEEFLVTTVTSANEDNANTGDIYGQSVFYLEPGTYWVKEEGFVEGRYDSDAWDLDTSIKEVLIVAGEEATPVQFMNIATKGAVEIVKMSTNGGTVIGWQFSIEGIDNDYSEIVTITTEMNGVGIISRALTAGTYIITEVGHCDPSVNMVYWELDAAPRTITIEIENTTSVEYTNNFNGGLTVQKTLSDPTSGSVMDWEFKIEKVAKDQNGNYIVESVFTEKTDENGLISRIVEPGTYRITEILDKDSPWSVVGENPKIVEVIAGQPTFVEFVNTLGSGEITIYKVDIKNNPLAGAVFLLEWSTDGRLGTGARNRC